MNLGSVIVLLIVIGILALAIRETFFKRDAHGTCGSCASCASRGSCGLGASGGSGESGGSRGSRGSYDSGVSQSGDCPGCSAILSDMYKAADLPSAH